MNSEDYNFTVYDKQTGAYRRNLQMPTLEMAEMNMDPETEILLRSYRDSSTYLDLATMETRPCNRKEDSDWEWNNQRKRWVDPDPETSRFKESFLPFAKLVEGMVLGGLVQEEELSPVMAGEIPKSISEQVKGMPYKARIELKIWWANKAKSGFLFKDPKLDNFLARFGLGHAEKVKLFEEGTL